MVLHTCSAVDIRTVFGQVRTFWNQLAWPDPETAYVFVSRILDDICKASIVYAKKLVSKCSSANRTSNEDLHFNREQCHVVNNLEFVLNAIRYFFLKNPKHFFGSLYLRAIIKYEPLISEECHTCCCCCAPISHIKKCYNYQSN